MKASPATKVARHLGRKFLDSYPEEAAQVLDSVGASEIARLLGARPGHYAASAAVLERLTTSLASDVVAAIEGNTAARILSHVDPQRAVAIVGAMPEDARERVLANLPARTAGEIRDLLTFPPDSAGGLMNPRLTMTFRPDQTVRDVVLRLRQIRRRRVNQIYLVSEDRRLLAVIPLQNVILASPKDRLDELPRARLVAVPVTATREEVIAAITGSTLTALPVVDYEGCLVGAIRHDVVVAAASEEATEDIQKFGGMEALDGPYLKVALGRMLRKRAGWLAALFLGEMLTATAMAYYEEEIARAVVLALFVPLIISSGGNSGSQASTLVIRAMALGEIRLRDWWRVMRRELAAGVTLGTILGSIGFLRIVVWQSVTPTYGQHYLLIALTVFGSLVGVVMFGTLTGSLLPFVLRRLGFDPASASAPFVATLVDVTGLVIYFTVASVVLRGTLL